MIYVKNFQPNFKIVKIILLIYFLCFSCSKNKSYDKKLAIDIYTKNDSINIDKSLINTKINIPKPQTNKIWLGSSSQLNQSIENIEKEFEYKISGWFSPKKSQINLQRKWYKNIFYYEDFSASFVYSPIIFNNTIFHMDSSGDITAIDLTSKKTLWHRRIFEKLWLKNYKVAHLGACNNSLFAVAGVNQIKAISQTDGNVLWSKDLSVIFNSTPICDGTNVYITSIDNKTFALNANNGEINWIHLGMNKPLAIFGNAQTVISGKKIIVSHSSGEIFALNKNNGEVLWQNDLNQNNFTNNLTDIDATPIIKENVVYAIGYGGKMKAMALENGKEIWQNQISSLTDFWIAGDFIYAINDDNQLMAISKKTGGIKWLSQLPKYRNPKKISSKYNYLGVIMAGSKLIILRSDGEILIASPFDGSIEKNYSLNKKILHLPIIIDNKIYFYGMSRFKTKLIEIE